MGGRPAGEIGVPADVREPQRIRVAQHDAQHPVGAGQGADPLPGLLVDAGGEEQREPARAVRYADGSEPGPGQLAGGLEDGLQHRFGAAHGAERQRDVQQPPQHRRIVGTHRPHPDSPEDPTSAPCAMRLFSGY